LVVYIIYINDARSSKYQIMKRTFRDKRVVVPRPIRLGEIRFVW